jgi:gas vesicle protein
MEEIIHQLIQKYSFGQLLLIFVAFGFGSVLAILTSRLLIPFLISIFSTPTSKVQSPQESPIHQFEMIKMSILSLEKQLNLLHESDNKTFEHIKEILQDIKRQITQLEQNFSSNQSELKRMVSEVQDKISTIGWRN